MTGKISFSAKVVVAVSTIVL